MYGIEREKGVKNGEGETEKKGKEEKRMRH